MSLHDAAGQYEDALKIAFKLYAKTEKPANKSDILAHMANFSLRAGHINDAQKYISEAEKFMEQGWDDEKDPVRSIGNARFCLRER